MSKRVFAGKVISNSGDKTVSVLVQNKVKHKRYKKHIIKSKKYLVHDQYNNIKIDDIVLIMESKPISKRKKWVVVEIVRGNV